MRARRLISSVVLLTVLPAMGAIPKSDIVAEYNKLFPLSVNIDQWKVRTNETSGVAFNTSFALASLIEMYEATHDSSYLDKFAALADPLVAQTDTARNLTDYKGRTRAGWSSTQFGQRVVFFLHTGLITYPLLRFALVVRDQHIANQHDRAANYQSISEQALKEFDENWRYDPAQRTGHYIFTKGNPMARPDLDETPLPFNQNLAGGNALIELWKLTGNQEYKQKAEALAREFKKNLTADATGAYVWNYGLVSYDKTGHSTNPSPEDVGHAVYDLQFAVLAAQEGIVFTQDDIGHFAKAYPSFAAKVVKPVDKDSLDSWIVLGWGSCDLYRKIAPDLMSRQGHQDARILNDLALMALYWSHCE